MRIFRLFVTAQAIHPVHSPGVIFDAICMVDSSDHDDAREQASKRLSELGWGSIVFRDALLLPTDPDISGLDQTMQLAFGDAKHLGFSVIVYPQRADAN